MPNHQNRSLQDVLHVEDDASLCEFTCERSGMLLWPLVRTAFLRAIISDLLYGTTGFSSIGKSLASVEGMSTLVRSVVHNRLHAGLRGEVCLMTTALGHIQRDGKVFNRLSDYFALSFPERTFVLEDQHDWRWPFPRHFARVMLHSPTVVHAALAGRVMVRAHHRRRADALISVVCARAEECLGWTPGPQRRAALVDALARRMAQAPSGFDHYRRLFSRLGVRLLIKEDGCYGSSAVALAAAHSLGIATAEHQHGAVSAGHDAYNVAPTMARSSAYRMTLPQHFLSYGNWWNEQISVPVEKIAIGNPHRTEQLATRRTATDTGRTDILVLGDGVETQLYLDLVQRLLPVAKRLGLQVVFRPHPMERRHVEGLDRPDFLVDVRPDIYTSFERAHAVVSEVSTGLFEAVGLAQRVVMWQTPKALFSFPTHGFETFDNAEELGFVLASPSRRALTPEAVEQTWASDWKANYARFLESVLVGRGPTAATEGGPM